MPLSWTATARKLFTFGELVTTPLLNLATFLTGTISGAASTAQIEDDAVTAAKTRFGPHFYATANTAANVITLTAAGHTITLAAGMVVRFVADANTTGAVDITFGGSTKNLFRNYNVELAGGDLKAGQCVEALYDGAQWQLLSIEANRQVIVGVDAGSTDAYAITPTPSVRALADITGVPVMFKANTINTGAATLTIFGLAAAPIVKSYDGVLVDGDIKAGQWVAVVHDGTSFQLVSPVTVSSARATVPVRQTVLSGPVDSNGHPLLLTIPSALYVSLQATTASPLVLTFAAGYDASGALDYISRITAEVVNAWTVPAAAGTYYLYAARNTSTGAITYGYTSVGLSPNYIDDNLAGASVSAGQHTFLINEMQMYLGDGGAAATVQRVFIGHVVTNGVSATSVVSYMFRGHFKSSADQAVTASDKSWTETHKLGMAPRDFKWVMVNVTADLGYVQNDEVDVRGLCGDVNPYVWGNILYANATTVAFATAWATHGLPWVMQTSGAGIAIITAANRWNLRAYAWRGW